MEKWSIYVVDILITKLQLGITRVAEIRENDPDITKTTTTDPTVTIRDNCKLQVVRIPRQRNSSHEYGTR